MILINTFLIIDGHSLAHRGYHALNVRLTAPDGTPTSMLVGFMNMLFKVQDDYSPNYTIIVFDSGKKNFRYELQSDYKADRKIPDDDLRIQLPILKNLLALMGYKVVIIDGVEADDTAASIARLAQKQGHKSIVLSSDKDLFQILDENISMLRPIKNGVSGAEFYDIHSFFKEYNFFPSSMSDYLALIGDKADNIKGVQGIGEKTAAKLLSQYPTIESIFSAINELPAAIQKKLLASEQENIIWTRDNLIRLKENIFDDNQDFLNECMNCKIDFLKVEEIAVRLGLKKILERIGSKRKVLPRLPKFSPDNIKPESDIIIDDYKSVLRKNPEIFSDNCKIWDLKTAYYLLHPDEAYLQIKDILEYLRKTQNPAQTLIDISCALNTEIESHEGLKDVMNNIDIPLIPVLNQMEDHGVRLSESQFSVVQSELEERINEIESAVIKETGVRINMNSSQQVSWLLFERMGFTPVSRTKGKTSYSTDSSVLEKLAALPNGSVPRFLIEYRELTKMLTSFVVPFQKYAAESGIIHTTFEPAATGTGRLSSRDPNLQNIPALGKWAQGIKKGLIPVEKGNIFVGADYSQIELRVLAHLSGEEKLIEAFTHNRDIHTETASWVFGVAPEFVTPELRRTAKMINFGLLYGMSEFGLSERLNISKREAKNIMERYFSALPGIKKYIEGIINQAKENGFARTLAGRIRPVKEIPAKSQGLDRALINMPIQGTAADIARVAMINFANKYPGKLFLQVHDSLVCECKENEAQEISESMREIMIGSGGEIKHLEVEVKMGKTLADV